MAKLISKTYGEALFELAVEEEKTEVMLEEISGIRQVFLNNPEYLKFLTHPRISVEEKIKTTEEIFSGRIEKQLLGFLGLIITKGRSENMMEILEYFLDKVKEFKGIGVAYVTTPFELKDDKKQAVSERLLATTSYRQMEMHYAVNPALLGGMQIRIGDRVVDSSIQTKLSRLEKDLLKVQVGQE